MHYCCCAAAATVPPILQTLQEYKNQNSLTLFTIVLLQQLQYWYSLVGLVIVFPKWSILFVLLLLLQPVTAAAPVNALLNQTINKLRCMISVLQMCNSVAWICDFQLACMVKREAVRLLPTHKKIPTQAEGQIAACVTHGLF